MIHLGYLELHIALSNLYYNVTILIQSYCVVIVSLSIL